MHNIVIKNYYKYVHMFKNNKKHPKINMINSMKVHLIQW
jgi:hypothetical protein